MTNVKKNNKYKKRKFNDTEFPNEFMINKYEEKIKVNLFTL